MEVKVGHKGLAGRLRHWNRQRKATRDASWRARRAAPGGGDWPRRVVYLSPDSQRPTGGVKVIYRHVEALRAMGVEACVMHERKGFRCTWFESTAPVLGFVDLRPGDHAVVPEVMPQMALRLASLGMPYTMFVQNGYLALETCSPADTRRVYEGASAVLSISDDTLDLLRTLFPGLRSPLLRVQHSVDASRFSPAQKQPLVTYMPRKMPQHARLVAGWLSMTHPHWEFRALDGIGEGEIAQALGRSRIFLAFSEYEGLPLPPIEAALAGNLVVGYPGSGAREYWREPLFHEVAFGDVRRFALAFSEVAVRAGAEPDAARMQARAALTAAFSEAADRERLARAARRLGWLEPAMEAAPCLT